MRRRTRPCRRTKASRATAARPDPTTTDAHHPPRARANCAPQDLPRPQAPSEQVRAKFAPKTTLPSRVPSAQHARRRPDGRWSRYRVAPARPRASARWACSRRMMATRAWCALLAPIRNSPHWTVMMARVLMCAQRVSGVCLPCAGLCDRFSRSFTDARACMSE